MAAIHTSRYRLETARLPQGEKLRIALVSDLHGRVPSGLLELLGEEKPDLIAVAGDLLEHYLPPDEKDDYHREIDAHSSPLSRLFISFLRRVDSYFVGRRRKKASGEEENLAVLSLLGEMAKIAPTYFSPGNHERKLSEAERERVAASGARYLENAWMSTDFGAVGGVGVSPDGEMLKALSEASGVRVLLCHYPEYHERYLASHDLDLVLSGHAHGGQIRLFGRGLFAPGQGLFPKRSGGLYGRHLVGRGLCNTTRIPRLFNPLDLPIVTLEGIAPSEK
jgi:predicted MPP superfamily phosphohydrolase